MKRIVLSTVAILFALSAAGSEPLVVRDARTRAQLLEQAQLAAIARGKTDSDKTWDEARAASEARNRVKAKALEAARAARVAWSAEREEAARIANVTRVDPPPAPKSFPWLAVTLVLAPIIVFVVALLDHFLMNRRKKAPPLAEPSSAPAPVSLFEELVARCNGDRGVAESLLSYEHETFPGVLSRTDAIERAYSRLEYDRWR